MLVGNQKTLLRHPRDRPLDGQTKSKELKNDERIARNFIQIWLPRCWRCTFPEIEHVYATVTMIIHLKRVLLRFDSGCHRQFRFSLWTISQSQNALRRMHRPAGKSPTHGHNARLEQNLSSPGKASYQLMDLIHACGKLLSLQVRPITNSWK